MPLETKTPVSQHLAENEAYVREKCRKCDDIIIRPMRLGEEEKVECLVVYLEVAVSNMMLEDSVIGKLMNHFWEIEPGQMKEFLEYNSLGISDVKELDTMEDAFTAMLAGNAIFFMDGYTKAIKIGSKGYPGMGVQEADEKVLRGSKEGFTDAVKTNSALVRKRLRDTCMKVEQIETGVRSHTVVQLLYVEDLVQQELLDEIKKRLDSFEIDGVMDSGVIEQLTEEVWYSPFPQFQTTQRPDRAAMELLNGRIVLLCDNTPMALILPTTFHSFMEVSEDQYNRFEMVTFLRVLRYLAVAAATLLPGLYLAAIRFHTQILPTNLILSFAEARAGVPFSSIVELLFLEMSFELIREAGVRMPGSLGNAIGIVGGLIIGQAAVSANLVSPIVVMIVALTALGSLAIPSEEFSSPFRLLKYIFLFAGGFLGIFGMVLVLYLLLGHLAGLLSFQVPYLAPFVKRKPGEKSGDGILRRPMWRMRLRPVFAKEDQKIRLKEKNKNG
ncbi:MAG: spore germination protein [Blautia sp.]|jgi:spore germination protein